MAAPELVGTQPLPDDLAELVFLAELGVARLELWCPWQITAATSRAVADRLAGAGLAIACVSSPSYLHGEPTGEGRRLADETLEIAAEVGAPVVNTYFGHGGDGDDVTAVDTYVRLAADLVARATRLGVTITLENEFDGFGHDPEHYDISRRAAALRRLVDLMDSPAFRLNFDAANFLCAGADVAAAADLLADAVGYVHVKDIAPAAAAEVGTEADNSGWQTYTDGDKVFRTTALGAGAVPWPHVLRRLDEAGYDGTFTLEPHCAGPQLRAQLEHSARLLRRSP